MTHACPETISLKIAHTKSNQSQLYWPISINLNKSRARQLNDERAQLIRNQNFGWCDTCANHTLDSSSHTPIASSPTKWDDSVRIYRCALEPINDFCGPFGRLYFSQNYTHVSKWKLSTVENENREMFTQRHKPNCLSEFNFVLTAIDIETMLNSDGRQQQTATLRLTHYFEFIYNFFFCSHLWNSSTASLVVCCVRRLFTQI